MTSNDSMISTGSVIVNRYGQSITSRSDWQNFNTFWWNSFDQIPSLIVIVKCIVIFFLIVDSYKTLFYTHTIRNILVVECSKLSVQILLISLFSIRQSKSRNVFCTRIYKWNAWWCLINHLLNHCIGTIGK